MPPAGEQGPLAQIAVRGDERAWSMHQILRHHGNRRRHADLRFDVVGQRRGIGKSGSSAEQLRPDKAVREPVQREVREQRVLVELGLHVPVAIAPGAAAKKHPRRLTHRAVVHRPGEGLWVRGIDQEVDEGRLASLLLPFDYGAFLRGEVGRVAGVVGHPREDREAQMDADDRFRMRMPKPRTQERACIAALRDEPLIAQFPHQPDPHVGRFDIADTVPGQRPREGEAGQRRDDDIEGVLGIAAMRSRVGQRHDDVLEVPERPGPSVVQDNGNGLGSLAAHMNEMDRHAVDLCAELREAVDLRFLRAPVETVLPVGH